MSSMKMCGATDVGLHRKENQDCFRTGEAGKTRFIIMCDGMGGMDAGGMASNTAADCTAQIFADRLSGSPDAKEIKSVMLDAIAESNQKILKLSHTGPNRYIMGTTMVAVVFKGHTAYYAHAGDSRAYHYGENGLVQLTRDHSMVQQLVDAGQITKEQAAVHPNRNIVTSCLGVDEHPTVDFGSVQLKKDDVLLVCSDGLTNMVKDERIAELISGGDFDGLADALIAEALQNGGIDNVTAVLALEE